MLQGAKDCHEFLKKFGHWTEEDRATSHMSGALASLAGLQESLQHAQSQLKHGASLLVEQLLLKASQMPGAEKDGICRKIEQWIAGGTYGLEEKDIHPTLMKFAHEIHQEG